MRIKNWQEFQHFKDRSPPWIKLYRYLLDDPDWHDLSGDDAKALVMLWLVASEDENKNGQLPEARKVAFRLRIKETQLNQLYIRLNKWLINDDINMISEQYQSVIPETETETETETDCMNTTCSLSSPAAEDREKVPYEKIRQLYNSMLPGLPECKVLTNKRKAQIRARWNNGLPKIETWEKFFVFVSKSDFLMGRVPPTNGRKQFFADLEWLTNETNYTKIYERKYHGKA